MTDASGDKRKFVILYEKYSRLMMKVALNILHDSFLAEDAVQDAFVHIARNMEKNRMRGITGNEKLPGCGGKECIHRYIQEKGASG